ncbi:flippase [Thermospira aquatica]|uniref:Flippase n=1 Tax=Thermospira aquatica TaxID=2828656 RepID=A0AAX3BF19_9SPIR|nr:flippase [Thermospira aquatica]URA10865.1 flippase [Thermospira aquatica]
MNQPSLKRNFFYNALMTFANFFLPMVAVMYTYRILGPVNIGKINYVQAWVNNFLLFANLNIGVYGLREIATVRDDKAKLAQTFSEILLILFVTHGVALLVFGVSFLVFPDFQREKMLFLLFGALLLFNPLSLDWFFGGIENYRFISLRNITVKLLMLPAIFLFVRRESDYVVYALILVLATVIPFLYNFLHSRHYVKWEISSVKHPLRHLKPMWFFWMSSLVGSLYVNVPVILLGNIAGDRAVGLATVVSKIVGYTYALVSMLNAVVTPRASYYYGNERTEEYEKLLATSLNYILLLALPAITLFMVIGKEVIWIIGGKEYEEAFWALRVAGIMLLLDGVNLWAESQLLLPRGMAKELFFSTLVASTINILCNIFFISRFSYLGIFISSIISQTINMAIKMFFAKHFTPFLKIKKDVFFYFLGCTGIFLWGWFVKSFSLSRLLSFFIVLLGGGFIYLVTLVVSGNEFYRKVSEKILSYLPRFLKVKKG